MLHWSDYAQMARETGATVLVPIYPMAPPKSTGTATTLVPPMADYLTSLIDAHGVDNVSLYGDSSGGSYAVLVGAGVGPPLQDSGARAWCRSLNRRGWCWCRLRCT